jgi:hypothetical protein
MLAETGKRRIDVAQSCKSAPESREGLRSPPIKAILTSSERLAAVAAGKVRIVRQGILAAGAAPRATG